MTTNQAKAVLRRAFSALNEKEKANVRFHLKRGTRILCEKYAYLFADGKGGC